MLNIKPEARRRPLAQCLINCWALLVYLCLAMGAGTVQAGKEPLMAKITSPYVDVYTGPGKGYPITYALEKGDQVELVKKRTDWVKIKTHRGRTGWVSVQAINLNQGINGEQIAFNEPTFESFLNRRFELGFGLSDYGGSDAINAYAGWRWTPNISVEAHLIDVVGQFSDATGYTANIVLQPFPEWRISPFVTLGSGEIKISPDTTLVDTEERTNTVVQAGAGVYGYITRRFVARLQYNNNKLVTDRNENEEIDEWRFALTAFF